MFLNVPKGKMSFGNSTTTFSPSQISGLTTWYRADGTQFQNSAGTTPITADGDPVGFITDYGSAGHNLIQATSTQRPTYKAAFKNGQPVWQYDGVDDYFQKINVTGSTFLSANTVTTFLVMYQNGAQANSGVFGWPSAGTPTNQFNIYATFANTIYFDYGDATGTGRISVAQPAGWDDAWKILMCQRNGTAGRIDVNATTILSVNSFSGNLNTAVSDVLTLGRSGGAVLSGYIAESLNYSTAISSSDITLVRNYLNTKYAVF